MIKLLSLSRIISFSFRPTF